MEMTEVNDDNGGMSCTPKAAASEASAAIAAELAVASKKGKSGAKAAAEKAESMTLVETAADSSSSNRHRWRSRGSSNKDKENTTSKSTAISTPSKSRRSSSNNWGLWRSSNDSSNNNNNTGTPKSSSRVGNRRRSFGVSPKAFHAASSAAPTAPAHDGVSSPSPPTTNNKAGQDAVLEFHSTVQSNLIKEGKTKVMEQHKLKRSTFKQVTSLKTWPLQERALSHYQQLMDQHLHRQTLSNAAATTANAACNTPTTIQEEEEEETSGATCQQQLDESNQKTPAAAAATCLLTPMAGAATATAAAAANNRASRSLSASSMSSTSSSSSAFSIEEPKRLLRDLCLSPAKSRLKFQLQQEFLQQQALTKITSSPSSNKSTSSSSSIQHDFGTGGGPALWSMEPRVFSVEKSEMGKRKYVVGHAGRFFDYYWRKVNRQHRHYYELILQDTPCRLYLDLEFHRQANPDITNDVAEVFLSQLLESLSQQLQESFPHQFGKGAGGAVDSDSDFHQFLDRTHIVDLDSSTEKKFSRHWIVHLPGGYLFAHTTALGRFMQEWVGNILTASQQQHQQVQGGDKANVDSSSSNHNSCSSVLFEHLFVNPPPSSSSSSKPTAAVSAASGHINNKTCLIDLGVYTRNRLFRLMGSTKFGKPPSAALHIADANEFTFPEGFGNESFYLPAMTEHQQQHQQQEPLSSQEFKQSNDDTVEVAVEKFTAAIDWTAHAEALAQTLVIPLNASKIDFPILPFDKEATNASGTAKVSSINNTKSSSSFPSLTSSSLSFGRSPFPMVDDFVLRTLATRGGGGGGIQGSIRAWSLECHVETGAPLYLTFQMSRNRYCECVGRAHKSNNIAWRVDLVLFHAVQTCHDPQCRVLQFRGTPIPLPYSVQQQIQQQLQSESAAATANDNNSNNDCDDDDDDGFEGVGDEAVLKALAAMNLEEIESRVGAAEHGADAAVPSTKQFSAKENVESPIPANDDDFDDDFPDDALAEAIMSNPELFP